MTVEQIKHIVEPVLSGYDIQYLGIFGSVARGEDTEQSDVDVLVKFRGSSKFSTYITLADTLQQLLGKKVDLVTVGGVNKYLKPYIEQDLQIIHGQR